MIEQICFWELRTFDRRTMWVSHLRGLKIAFSCTVPPLLESRPYPSPVIAHRRCLKYIIVASSFHLQLHFVSQFLTPVTTLVVTTSVFRSCLMPSFLVNAVALQADLHRRLWYRTQYPPGSMRCDTLSNPSNIHSPSIFKQRLYLTNCPFHDPLLQRDDLYQWFMGVSSSVLLSIASIE